MTNTERLQAISDRITLLFHARKRAKEGLRIAQDIDDSVENLLTMAQQEHSNLELEMVTRPANDGTLH